MGHEKGWSDLRWNERTTNGGWEGTGDLMTEERDGGEGGGGKDSKESPKVTVQEQKLIDDYLKQVERNLKGFTREAKDSILIEIREHILERVEEETGKAGGNSSGEEATGGGEDGGGGLNEVITTILEEYGTPEEVARAYSPIIRASSRKLIAFQIYSVILSLSVITIIIREFLRNPSVELNLEENRDLILGFIGFLMALFTIGHTIEYHQRGIRFIGYSFLTILTNGIFAVICISYLIDTIGANSDIVLPEALLIVVSIVPFYISYQGFRLMTLDTKDGISPLSNASFKLIPVILLMDLLALFFVNEQMNNSFDEILLWNTAIGYGMLMIFIIVGISNSSVMILRWFNSTRTHRIQKEIFILTMASMIIVSSLFVGVVFDRIELTRSIDYDDFLDDQEGSLEEYDPEILSLYDHSFLLHNETPYTWDLTPEDDHYIFSLDRWSDDHLSRSRTYDIPVPIHPKEFKLWFGPVKASGQYIHAFAGLEKPSDIWGLEEREDRYFLFTFDGKLVGSSLIPSDGLWRLQESVTTHSNTAQICYYETNYTHEVHSEGNRTGSYKVIHSFNITRFRFSDGQLTVGLPRTYPVSLSTINTTIDWAPYISRIISGDDSFSLVLKYSEDLEYVANGYERRDSRYESFVTTIAWNGTVILPWTKVLSDTPEPCFIVPEDVECSRKWDFHGSGNVIFFTEYAELNNDSRENYKLVSFKDGVISEQLIHSAEDSIHVRTFGEIAMTDEDGNTYLPFVSHAENEPSLQLFLRNVIVSPDGLIISSENLPLDSLPIFDMMETRFNDERYDNLNYGISPSRIDHDGNATYVFLDVWVFEEPLRYEEGGVEYYERIHSVRLLYLLKISDGNISYVAAGPDIEARETKDDYYNSQIFGILGGVTISLLLWGVMRKRSRSVNYS
jgi:hypothetical protein